MKIALFTVKNFLACAHALFGYRCTLERMGHKVLDCSLPGNAVHDVANVASRMPTISELNKCDCVLLTYAEYVHPWLNAIYGLESWRDIRVPIIARYDESMDRADLNLPARVPELKRWARHHFFPAAQDAERFGGSWLPFGADAAIFKPWEIRWPKKYDLAFIGSLYSQRQNYLQMLAPHLKEQFQIGNVYVQRLSGLSELESTELLAEEYRAIKVFFCLPPMSKLIVQKVFDVMASGTFVMYPALIGEAEKNLNIFQDGKHLAYYEYGYFADNGRQIHRFVEANEERESIARAGRELVHAKYTLEKMLKTMLSVVP